MAKKGNNKGAVAGTLLALIFLGYACSHDDSPSAGAGPSSAAGPSVTVASVETFADLTLSDGRRVHNTLVDSIAQNVVNSTYSTASDRTRNACITQNLNTFAQNNLVGRSVSEVQSDTSSTTYGVAPLAGYSPARVYFVDSTSSHLDASTAFSSAMSNASSACSTSAYPDSTTSSEPTTTSEAPVYVDTDPDVYVDTPDVDTPKRRHTGNSGHPCLPGERDGDGDGYCGEGR